MTCPEKVTGMLPEPPHAIIGDGWALLLQLQTAANSTPEALFQLCDNITASLSNHFWVPCIDSDEYKGVMG